ncbi:MAG: hypothetical protein HOP19_04805 [Acidobacteria bacterium]|nr:hypothetical protein [Acidobacteriota bacterium]
MSKPCSVCTHPNVEAINAKLLQNLSYREITERFKLSKSAMSRHVTGCVADFLDAGREAAAIKQAVITEESVTEMWQKIKRLVDVADAWLTDPNDPTRYTLDARAEQTSVIYQDATDLGEDGKPKAKRADLQELLDRLAAGGTNVAKVKLPRVDYPKVMLDAARDGAKFLELLAKLRGEFTRPKENLIPLQEKIDWLVKEHGYTQQGALTQLKEWGQDS